MPLRNDMDALRITLKDVRLLIRDRRALVVLLILPLVLMAVIGSSTGRLMSRSDSWIGRKIQMQIVDQDQSELSRRLSEVLATDSRLEVSVDKQEPPELDATPQRDTPPVAFDGQIVIGPEFQTRTGQMPAEDLLLLDRRRSKIPDIKLTVRPESNPLLDDHLRLLLENAFRKASIPLIWQQLPALWMSDAATDDMRNSQPEPDSASDGSNRVYRFVVPAYTVLFVFFLVTVMGRSFILERELGTLRRLRTSPISSSSILTGKTLPFLLLSVIQTFILLAAGRLVFGMSWGVRPWLILPVVVSTSLAATTLGLAFAAFVRTDSQVSAIGNLIVLATAGISGCLVPRNWMPELSQKISLITPHAWSLDAYRELLTNDDPDVGTVAVCCTVLILFTVLFFAVALHRFRRRPD